MHPPFSLDRGKEIKLLFTLSVLDNLTCVWTTAYNLQY